MMKLRLLLIVAVALLAAMAGAQRQRHPIPTVRGPGEAMQYGSALVSPPPALQKELKLTPAQVKKLAAINAKYDAKWKAAYDSAKNHVLDMKTVLPITEARCRDLYASLTPKQRTSLRKWVDTHHRHRGPPEPH